MNDLMPWESIELSAQNQIRQILDMPELMTLAIMPNVHAGYDLCICRLQYRLRLFHVNYFLSHFYTCFAHVSSV
jgi:hypothetical protein